MICKFRGASPFLLWIFLGVVSSGQTSKNSIGAIALTLQQRDFGRAIELLRTALKQSPDNAELWAMQGAAYAGEGKGPAALASFQKSLKFAPDYLPALHGAAQLEYDSGDAGAIPLIETILRLQPADTTSHAMLAVLEYQNGHYALAAKHFEKSGTLFDSKVGGLEAYATCLVKLKQFDHAAEVFQRALNIEPNSSRERQLLAAIQLMAGKSAEALDTLAPLLEASSPEATTLELASTAYEEGKDTSQAVDLLRRAIMLEPNNVGFYLDFANISNAHGSFQVGIDVINDGIALQPAAAPLYFARGFLYVQLARYEKAEADFEKAYELDPSQTLSSAAQGMAAAQENDLNRGLTKVQASLARKPNDPLLLYLQADILAERQPDPGTPEFHLALRSAKRAVALQPNLAAAHGVLAKLYLQAENYRDAAAESRQALASNPKDQGALYHLILSLRKAGNSSEIPDLLKRLAILRRQAAKEESDRYRYRLVEGGTAPR